MVHVKPSAAQPYDSIARLYDPWSRSVVEDVSFYVEEASRAAPGPVVELGVGTGRIAVPVAAAGVAVIGVDSSAGMLEICREQAELAGVDGLLDLRLGDYSSPPVAEPVALVLCPFRAYLHLHSDEERLRRAARGPRPPRARRPPRVRRVHAERRGHRGDARTLARAGAGHLRAGRLGHAGAAS